MKKLFIICMIGLVCFSCEKEIDFKNDLIGVWSLEQLRIPNGDWIENPDFTQVEITSDFIGGLWSENYQKTKSKVYLSDGIEFEYYINECSMIWYFSDGSSIKMIRIE